LAIVQPPFISPTRLRASAFTFSKKTWQNSEAPLISWMGEIVTPGWWRSKRMKLMPSCLAAVGSVRTRQNIQSARCAPVVQILDPLMT
jgi:hypothetical protein